MAITEIINQTTEVCCVLFLLTLFGALRYKRERTPSQFVIELIFAGEIVLIIADTIFRLLSADHPMDMALYIDYIIVFISYVFIVCSFTWYFYTRLEEKGILILHRVLWQMVNVYSLVVILLFVSSVWTRWFFYVDSGRKLVYTDRFYLVFCLFIPLVMFDLAIIWIHRKRMRRMEAAVLFLYCLLPIAACLVDARYSTVTTHLALTLDACMLYTYISAEQERNLIRSKKELAEIQLNTLASQINPHFIYNTLSSIESLGRSQPEKARQLISLFSDYLCDNYMDVTSHPLIRVEEELKHVDHYLSIEKVRFPNLDVLYDIQASDFMIPCLSIQPLAENAVKHGICRRRKSAGTLKISSEEKERAYVIRVEDDGIGFDASQPPDTERPHLGIQNVAKRLELLCRGTLTVRSEIGTGTECIITIPKGGA